MKRLLIVMIRGYQSISRCFPARCRFYPTCSDYTIEAVQKHGIVTGLWISLKRICRCHPWNPGGVDFVPKSRGQRTENRSQKTTSAIFPPKADLPEAETKENTYEKE